MLARFDPSEVLRLIEAERVTRLFAVPTMVRSILDDRSLATRDVSSLVQTSIGGAPSAPELVAEVEERLGCECICGYGMTESSPTLTRSLDKPGTPRSVARRATTGLPILGVDLRVLDDDGAEVAWDGATVGEVCARSNHVMTGYWNRPDETADALRDGWLHTGDLAVVDAEGYVTIVDRRKDLIVSGGANVSLNAGATPVGSDHERAVRREERGVDEAPHARADGGRVADGAAVRDQRGARRVAGAGGGVRRRRRRARQRGVRDCGPR